MSAHKDELRRAHAQGFADGLAQAMESRMADAPMAFESWYRVAYAARLEREDRERWEEANRAAGVDLL